MTLLSLLALFSSAILFGLTIILFFHSRWFQSSINEQGLEAESARPLDSRIMERLQRMQLSSAKIGQATAELSALLESEIHKQVEVAKLHLQKDIHAKDLQLRDIQKKYETTEENYNRLDKRKLMTEAVIRSVAKGVIVINDEDKIVFTDSGAEKILGAHSHQVEGKPIRTLDGEHALSMVDENGGEEIGVQANQNAAKEYFKEYTAVIETIYGQTKGILSAVPFLNSERQSEEYKKEFFSNASHELRSPLICIRKSIEALQDLSGEVQAKAHLEIAERNAARLEKLVGDMLELAKLESGRMVLHLEPVPLQPFIDDIRRTFMTWADQKEIEIKTDLPAEPAIFSADELCLQRVVSNLLSNALKFSPRHSSIEIRARIVPENSGPWIEIGVKDSGPGLKEEDKLRVFQKFAFGAVESPDGEKGTGLGLITAKQVVELHKGKIWVDSKPGQGCYFAFSIPQNAS